MRWRPVSLAALAVCASLVIGGCGGGARPRPDLIFVSTRSGVYDIYAMNRDGSRQQRLTHGSTGSASTASGLDYATDPAWSRDGRSIAFTSSRTGSSKVFVMNADGKDVRQLTHGSGDDTRPTWAPDGRRIAFVHGSHLEVMSADGSNPHRITRGTSTESDPAWSPDGRWIAYVVQPAGMEVRDIWLVRPDGSHNHLLTNLGASTEAPAWSPDGQRIAFTSSTKARHFSIYTIRAAGGDLHLVSTSSVDAFAPSWSPDGGTIAFDRDGAIVTVAPDGSGEQVVTDPKDNDSMPVWNPLQAPQKKGGS